MRGPPLRAAAVLAVVSSPPPSVATGCVARLQLDGGIRLGGHLNWPRRGGGLLLAPHRARKNGWVMAVPVQFLMGSGLHVLCAIVMQHALGERSHSESSIRYNTMSSSLQCAITLHSDQIIL